MFSRSISFLLMFFIISPILLGQQVDDDFIAGKWKIEKVIVPDGKFNDKREIKILEELVKTTLHFKGDGHFSFIYDGSNKELIRNITELESSRWLTIDGENAILLEKGSPLMVMPVEIGENIVIQFFKPIKLQVSKIEDEKVNFSPVQDIAIREQVVPEQKIDSVFKQVMVNEENLKNNFVSRYPIVKTCENLEVTSRLRICFNRAIQEVIVDKLDLKKYESLAGNSRFKVFLDFVIDSDGVIKNINVEFPDEELSYDLKLIVNNIKIIKPALDEKNQPILSRFEIPITLLIN